MKTLDGIFPPIASPFGRDGELLIESFKRNLERWAQAPLAGLTVLGSNGESPYLSDDEKLRLVRTARPLISDARTMIAGAGKESTRLCIEFVRRLADLGVDYALVGTPCYFKSAMSDDALFAHFWSVADESPIPILVYNVPQFTGVNTGAALMARLAVHENIAGLKESSGNLALQADIRRGAPARFKLLVGAAPTLFPSLVQGASGGVVAIGCVLPEMTTKLYRAFAAGEWHTAAELQSRLSPPAAAVTTQFGIAGLKAALNLVGYEGGFPRLPLLPLDEKKHATLRAVFEAAGVLEPAPSA